MLFDQLNLEIEIQEADILVGADGIWSAVRAQMYNEGKVKERSKDRRGQTVIRA